MEYSHTESLRTFASSQPTARCRCVVGKLPGKRKKKYNHYTNHYVNSYFWRTHHQQEIDMIEETGGNIFAWEFKWNENAKVKLPSSFIEAYPGTSIAVVNRQNYMGFLKRIQCAWW